MNKILCVDDDLLILKSFQRSLCQDFDFEVASSGEQGLTAVRSKGPFAVVVSDLRMPGMDGIEFLSRVKEIEPDCVRVMLTGNADLHAAIDAVNEGNIFRFLTKPCSPEILARVLSAGSEYHRLLKTEKILLEKTLAGSVQVLTEVLSLVNPMAFSVASRVQPLVTRITAKLKIENPWHIEVGTLLSQIGCVTVPEETLTKLHRGLGLSSEELRMLQSHPQMAHHLISRIPRLEPVADIIVYQQKLYDGSGLPRDDVQGQNIPIGARILKLALDFDMLVSSGNTGTDALEEIERRENWYDPECVAALRLIVGEETKLVIQIQTRKLEELTNDMILAEDVVSLRGLLMVARGQQVTESLRVRLQNMAQNNVIPKEIKVQVPIHLGAQNSQEVEVLT